MKDIDILLLGDFTPEIRIEVVHLPSPGEKVRTARQDKSEPSFLSRLANACRSLGASVATSAPTAGDEAPTFTLVESATARSMVLVGPRPRAHSPAPELLARCHVVAHDDSVMLNQNAAAGVRALGSVITEIATDRPVSEEVTRLLQILRAARLQSEGPGATGAAG